MKKVFLITDDPNLNSGLATVGRALAQQLFDDYKFTYIGINAPPERNKFSFEVLSYADQDYGAKIIPALLKEELPEALITIGDVEHYNYIPFVNSRQSFAWLPIVTIDSINYIESLPNRWQPTLYNADCILTPSLFGKQAIENFLEIETIHCPFGRESEMWQLPHHEVDELRRKLHLEHSFVILIVNRNSIRKQLPLALKTLRLLRGHNNPHFAHGAKLYLHTNALDPYGYHLNELVNDYGLLDHVHFSSDFHNITTNPSLDKTALREIYNLAAHGTGCFFSTSGGEGFGLTILDALACGIPVFGSTYSSIPEIIGDGGVLFKPAAFLTTEEGTELAIHDASKISDKILDFIDDADMRTKLTKQALKQSEKFDWKKTGEIVRNTIDLTSVRHASIPKPTENTPDVDLIIAYDTNWQTNTYYPVRAIAEIEEWNSLNLNEAIDLCPHQWIALISPGTTPQRGWLSELVKLANADTAAIVSTCMNSNGRIVEGELKIGTNILFFCKEGARQPRHDSEIITAPFSAVLLNKAHFQRLGKFNAKLTHSHYDLEYCLRARQDGQKIVLSARSIVLKTKPYMPDPADNKIFRNLTEIILNRETEIIYKGPRAVIRTPYGDFNKDTPVQMPYRMALELIVNYSHIQLSDYDVTPSALATAIDKSGKIGIVRNRGMGDVFAAAYFGAAPIKYANPDVHLTFITDPSYMSTVEMLPFVDEVLAYPQGLTKAKDFDYFRDLSFVPETVDPHSQRSRPAIFAEHLGNLANYKYNALTIPDTFLQAAKQELEQRNIGNGRQIIGIQTTCASPIRVYAPEYLRELVTMLVAHNFDIVLLGLDPHWHWGLEQWNSKHMASFVNQISDLRVVLGLMAQCDYFIAPDSGLMHAAGFMNLKTLALFGNIDPRNRIEHYPTVEVLYPEGELDCIPCGDIYNPCPECANLEAKGKFAGACMRQLYPERVLLKLLDMADKTPTTIMAGKQEIACPICGKNDVEIVNKIDFWDKETIPTCIYVRCKNDGLVFNNPQVPSIVYEKEYFQSGQSDLYYENILSEETVDSYNHQAAKIDEICINA